MEPTTRQILICAVISFFLAVSSYQHSPSSLVNVAYKRPAFQISTQDEYRASNAVDEENSCAQTQKETDPWWRVDLGKSVWVESVLIASRTDSNFKELSDVEIRIGDKKGRTPDENPLCRQGLIVPKEPSLYNCAEPMLGKYVYVIEKGIATLTLCEVKVYVNGTAIDQNVKYLVPTSSGKYLEKATYFKFAGNDVFYFKLDGNYGEPKISRKDIVIDLPPRKGSLKLNDTVLMPVEYPGRTCGPKNSDIYLNGTFLAIQDKVKGKSLWLVKSVYTPLGQKEKKSQHFQCSLEHLRTKGDICQLENKCSASLGTHCDTKYISSSFPPGAYHCECDYGFVPDSKPLPGNVLSPGGKCIKKQLTAPLITHSKQNVAANMSTTASSTDNYAGCKTKDCKEVKAFGHFVVDGDINTCFRSLTEYKPWLMVKLNDYHPIFLVRIMTSKKISLEQVKISIGDIDSRASRKKFTLCAFKEKIEENRLLSFGCNELYVYGNAVKISTESSHSILSLCEVEVYADAYVNIALKQFSEGKSGTVSSQMANDGKFDTCFVSATEKDPWWYLELGANVRVSVVFILTSDSEHDLEGVDILVGKDDRKETVLCTTVRNQSYEANYFECKEPAVGSFLNITLARGPQSQLKLCEVEVFQTKIVNLAAQRPTLSGSNEGESYKGCDQNIGEGFSTRQWWSVDLKAICQVHLVRVVTDVNYKPDELKNLVIKVDLSKDGFGIGEEVARLNNLTKESVQTITLPKNIKARFVSLYFYRIYANLKFREVEIYNGELQDVDECKKPNVCPYKYRCENLPGSYSCKCDGGYKPTGPRKKCKDVDECASKNSPCQMKESFCKNTEGSFKCLCNGGYEPDHDSKGHFRGCEDIDECTRPKLNKCPKTTSCVNRDGDYTCKCATGYEQDKRSHATGLKIKCKDIDECSSNSTLCHEKASCSNTYGSYKCTCDYGYAGNGVTFCSRLESCSDNKDCKPKQFCKDIKGTHLCDCIEGYHFKGKQLQCVDKNECELEKNICGSNSVCTNKKGSFRCNCLDGFESDNEDGKNCSDTDECSKKERCGDVAVCNNTLGSFQCICPKGFSFDYEERKCYDIDECAVVGSCGLNMLCLNSAGSYSCSCRFGYRANKNQLSCLDIDECEEQTYSCPRFSRCKNKNGGYDCPCNDGFEKTTGGQCSEICTPKCDKNSYCRNGKCLCRRGFLMGLGHTCQPNEGLLGSGMSLQSPAILLTAALLWRLALI